MNLHDIIDRLGVLGLDADEASVYVHLSMMGPSKASDVAASAKLHRTEAYRTLQNLVQRGFASATLSRPTRFEAAPPERLFGEMLAAQRATEERIQRAQGEIASALQTLRGQHGPGAGRNTFKVVQGRREIYSVLERMVRDAQSQLRVLTTHEGAVGMADLAGILDLLVQRAQEGVELRAAMRTTPNSRARLRALPSLPSITFRHWEADHIVRMAIADDHELLLWVVNDPSSRLASELDVALWSDATDFVGGQSALFEAAWREATDLAFLPPDEEREGAADEMVRTTGFRGSRHGR